MAPPLVSGPLQSSTWTLTFLLAILELMPGSHMLVECIGVLEAEGAPFAYPPSDPISVYTARVTAVAETEACKAAGTFLNLPLWQIGPSRAWSLQALFRVAALAAVAKAL